MTGLAVGWEVAGHVVGAGRCLKIGQMTIDAVAGQAAIDSAAVAVRAGGHDVRTGKRERGVIEPGTGPGGRFVAAVAVLCPALGQVIRFFGAGKVRLMARFAAHRRAGKVTHLSAGMAAEAGDGSVRTKQGKSRAVVQHDLAFRNPVVFVVTFDASCTKLPPMLVFVTADTTSLGKHGYRTTVVMATQALSVFMRTDQGDPGFAGVVKMKVGSDLFPAAAFMA